MAYYLESDDREHLRKILKYHVCAECGSELEALYDIDKHLPYLVCSKVHGHEGITREPSRYEKEGMESLTIIKRREKMENRFGKEHTKTLARYQMPAALITREAASEIVETLWRGASPVEKTKAIMICASYNLNPLMNHLFMLPFQNKKTGKTDYAVVIGIEATRLMAKRKHHYTYLDLTPRRATRDELEKILGDKVDPKKLYFITKLKDIDTNEEVYGLGEWEGIVYGSDKGNSPANMASIRSERQALKRLYPAEMPAGVEVVDERFVDAIEGEYQEVEEETGEITKPQPQAKTAVADGPEPEEQPEMPPEPVTTKSEPLEPEPSPIDLDWLKESLDKMQWTTVGKWLKEKYGVTGQRVSQQVKQLTKEQSEEFVAEVQKRLEASGF